MAATRLPSASRESRTIPLLDTLGDTVLNPYRSNQRILLRILEEPYET
jgi:hypothetical protein